jgi:hypothetical protein
MPRTKFGNIAPDARPVDCVDNRTTSYALSNMSENSTAAEAPAFDPPMLLAHAQDGWTNGKKAMRAGRP